MINLWREKEHFQNYLCLVDAEVGFLELSMFTNAPLHNKYYLMKWIEDSDMKKKKHFVRYHLYCF